jgi:Uma2 family endonuclease
MRAVMLEAPEDLLADRRRKGLDLFDEVWEGILHMPPPPSDLHQRFGTRLLLVLAPIAEARGLVPSHETGIYRPGTGETDYRVPDLVFSRPEDRSHRGVEGRAELVVEIRSPGDETYEKLPFYAACGVAEVLVAHPEMRTIELFVLRGGHMHAVVPDENDVVRSAALDATFEVVAGPKLRVRWPGGQGDV